MYENVRTSITIKEEMVQMFSGTGFGKHLKRSYCETSAVICSQLQVVVVFISFAGALKKQHSKIIPARNSSIWVAEKIRKTGL